MDEPKPTTLAPAPNPLHLLGKVHRQMAEVTPDPVEKAYRRSVARKLAAM